MTSVVEGQKRNIIIIGGGIIGCTSAYFITRHPSFNPEFHSVTIIEATRIASAASGKAGGLLALWAYPSSIVPLSYKLHAELAAEHNGASRWGYRQVYCGSLTAKGRPLLPSSNGDDKTANGRNEEWSKLPKLDPKAANRARAAGVPGDLDWFVPETITSYAEMGDPSTTAQVHPFQFTTSMAELAKEKGAKVEIGSVTDIDYTGGEVKSVTYKDKTSGEARTIPATDVIVSAGPWTSHILPAVPIEATRAHSVTIKADVSPYAIFSEVRLPAGFGRTDENVKGKNRYGKTVSPEMYARPNGEVYACGEGDQTIPLPSNSDLVECSESACQDIIDYCGSISDELRDGEILVKQACYLPSVAGGQGPLIGPTRVKGLLLATGHTCWGIQNSCATGKLISEFIYDGKATSARIDSLDPRRIVGKLG